MLQELPTDRPYDWVFFDGDEEPFSAVHPTTWRELERRELVRPWTFNRYGLTGPGWIAALKTAGQFDSRELKENAGRLSAALKGRVEGRKTDALVQREELERETGLPESLVYDAIDSHLLLHLFNRRDAQWAPDDSMNHWVLVPIDFDLKLK